MSVDAEAEREYEVLKYIKMPSECRMAPWLVRQVAAIVPSLLLTWLKLFSQPLANLNRIKKQQRIELSNTTQLTIGPKERTQLMKICLRMT